METPGPMNAEDLVEQIRQELFEIDSMAVNDHAQRFEELSKRLTETLSTIDGF